MFQAKPITRALAFAFGGLACAGVTSSALAQAPAPQTLERVEITGSAIKRIEGESALPVTVITKQEIDQLGVVNAQQLVDKLVTNSGGGFQLSNSLGDAARPGFAGASLRGLGFNSTLILLNGRRMAVYAFDGGGVNLTQIPFAAIERVEVLREGASAIYGTDAVAGVINFITRKDYSGLQVYGGAFLPQEKGGEQYQANILAGYGDLAKDRFNVFGVLSYTKQESVAAVDRDFAKTALRRDISIDENVLGFPYVQRTSSNAFPGNIFTSGTQTPAGAFRNPYASPFTGSPPGIETNPYIGVFPPTGCTPPASYGLTSSETRCRYDYLSQIDILPENEVWSFLGRATFQLNPNNQLFAEASWAKQKAIFRISQTPASEGTTKIGADGVRLPLLYPATGPYYPGAGIVPAIPGVNLNGEDLNMYWRALETGPRTNQAETDEWRILLGASGLAWGWDYNIGTYYVESKVTETYQAGYILESKLLPTFFTGVINPFGYQDAAGMAALNSTQILGEVRQAKSSNWVVDGVAAKEIMNLPAGPMSLAVGFQYQDQKYNDNPAAVLRTQDIIGGAGEQLPVQGDRTVFSLFGELSIPIIKNLDAQVAVRWDDYSDFGSNVSPKVGLRWQPTSALLVRGSYGQGFRAPTIPDLVLQPSRTNAAGAYNDPWYEAQVPGGCNTDPDAGPIGIFNPLYCGAQLSVTNAGNKSLEPETSKQWSVGFVLEPTRDFSVGLDFWWIYQKDLLGFPNGDVIIQDCIDNFDPAALNCNASPYASLTRSRQSFVGGGVGVITVMDTAFNQIQNIADQNTNGVDIEAKLRVPQTGFGDLTFTYNATYIFNQEQKLTFIPGQQWEQTVGTFANLGAVQRYRHYLAGTWNNGPWTVTLGNNYSSGYEDEYTNADGSIRHVAAWSTWDLYTRWTGVKNLALVAGITNLFNNTPPTTNQQDYFQIAYDPSVVSPLGRVYYLTAQYKFF